VEHSNIQNSNFCKQAYQIGYCTATVSRIKNSRNWQTGSFVNRYWHDFWDLGTHEKTF